MIDRFYRPQIVAAVLCALVAAACDDDDPTGNDELGTPSNVTATVQGPTSIALSWNTVSGASGYVVERAEGESGGSFTEIATPTSTSHTDDDLTPNTTYRYRVAASASGGRLSNFSSEASAITEEEQELGAATISDDITSDRTLFADTVYTLDGFVKVANGATLTIEAGTTILGSFERLGSSLFVLRGAQIRAMGTAENPIVFTSERPEGERQPGDWGGLILLGNGVLNRDGDVVLEGTENFGAADGGPIVYSGGTDNADSSGELHYVRVEFAGFATAENAELNSFTFAAVGSGTQMDHLQSLAGLDDSFEWFGGAADAKYLVSYESGDDHFDISEGFQGRLQYLIAYQSKVLQPRPSAGAVSGDPQGIENDGCAGDGCTAGELSEPFNLPFVANFTLVGTGPGVVDGTSGGNGMVLRRGTGGFYVNGVATRWPVSAISLRNSEGSEATEDRVDANDLILRNVLSVDNGTLFEAGEGRFTVDAEANAIESGDGEAAGLFVALPADPSASGDFDWNAAEGSAAATGGLSAFDGVIADKAGTFVLPTEFRGAAPLTGDDVNWWVGWTNYADN